jgi:hypothetical protein
MRDNTSASHPRHNAEKANPTVPENSISVIGTSHTSLKIPLRVLSALSLQSVVGVIHSIIGYGFDVAL